MNDNYSRSIMVFFLTLKWDFLHLKKIYNMRTCFSFKPASRKLSSPSIIVTVTGCEARASKELLKPNH